MKTIGVIIVVFLTLLLCIEASAQDSTGPSDRSLENITLRGVIIVGTDDTFPPLTFRDDKTKEIIGLDVDLARKAAGRLGLRVEFKPVPWDKIVPRLNTGEINCVWSGLSMLPEREHQMLFSQPYLESRQVIVVKKGSAITCKRDLKEKAVGIQRGSSSEKWVRSDPEIIDSLQELSSYMKNTNAFQDLESGRIEALITDEVIARHMVSKNPEIFSILDDTLGKETFAVDFRKADSSFRNAVNTVLQQMIKDGTVDLTVKKWLGPAAPRMH